MYRNKSSISLRNLTHSLKQSINLDRHKAQSREFIPLRTSSSTINLANNKNTINKNNFDQDYLMMLETRKSKLSGINKNNRESNYSELRYDLKDTKQLIQRKQRQLLRTAKGQSRVRFSQAQVRATQPLPTPTDQITSTLQILTQQQNKIKQNLSQNYFSTNLKFYNKYIDESQILSIQLKQITRKQAQFIEYKRELNNRLNFLQQEFISIEMNFTEDLAEKQYCEQFLHQYQNQNQLKQQAQNVLKLIELEYTTKNNIQKQKRQLQQRLQKFEQDFKQWKMQQNLELKQKRFENKLKQLRIELMKIEQDLDCLTQQLIKRYNEQNMLQHGIRKVRQYICTYFKRYNKLNINHISHNQIADGIDIFLCKQELINEFEQFMNQKTQKIKLMNGMYSIKLKQFCDCLKKIQNLFIIQKTQLNKVILNKYQQQIISTKNKIQNLIIKKQFNLKEIFNLKQNIQKLLAQDSLSMIQLISKKNSFQTCFNKNNGFFNLSQIKTKVKSIKLQQAKRIKRVTQIFLRLKKLQQKELIFSKNNEKQIQKFNSQKQSLKSEIQIWSRKVSQIQIIKQGYQSKKLKCDKFIEEAIMKMKQKDDAENSLNALQKQIQKLKKQKIQAITKKHQSKKIFQPESQHLLQTNKQRYYSGSNLSQFLKNNWVKKLESHKMQNKLKLQQFQITQKHKQIDYKNKNTSGQSRLKSIKESIKEQFNYQFNSDEQKIINNNTQSSPKSSKQRLSLGALNSILLSKCNLVESKNMVSKPKQIKQSSSTFGLGIVNKENYLQTSQQLLIDSKKQSVRTSKNSRQKNHSRKGSTSKITQKSTLKQSNQIRNQLQKLTLSSSNGQSLNKKLSHPSNQNTCSKNVKISNKPTPMKHTKSKDINQIISNKLLRR